MASVCPLRESRSPCVALDQLAFAIGGERAFDDIIGGIPTDGPRLSVAQPQIRSGNEALLEAVPAVVEKGRFGLRNRLRAPFWLLLTATAVLFLLQLA